MKTLLAIIGVAALLATVSNAQTSNTFFGQIEQWATTIDTNNITTFGQSKGYAETGVESAQNQGVPIDNVIRLEYDLVHPANISLTNCSGLCLGPNLVERDSGVQGAFVSTSGGLDLGFFNHDFRLDLCLNGGYATTTVAIDHHVFGEVEIEAKKALGSKTFMFIGYDEQFPHLARMFSVGGGFTF